MRYTLHEEMQGSRRLLRRLDPTHWPGNQKLGGRSPRAQPFESPETSSNKVTALSLPTEEIRPKMQGSLKSVTLSNHPKIRMTGSWFLCKKRVNEPQRELRLHRREKQPGRDGLRRFLGALSQVQTMVQTVFADALS